MEVRIQKYFTDCGVMSRRAAEAEIAAGKVKVNGKVAVTGQKIDTEKDVVTYNGLRVESQNAAGKVYIMINKPRGYVTTLSDEKGRKCVTDLVGDLGVRLYPVGRLDMDSEGLLLLTNDGEFANMLTHPSHDIPKIYHITVEGALNDTEIRKLGTSIVIDGKRTRPVDVRLVSRDFDVSVLEMTLFEGRNRQIRRMCEVHGVNIKRLKRVAVGNVKLGDLAPGKWKRLTHKQVTYLKDANRKGEN